MIKVASLFSGVGGLDWGFHINTQYEVVFANDFDHWACETYRFNFEGSDKYLREGDIAQFIDQIPDHHILLGGFPCQPFSLAGHRQGFDDAAVDKKTGQPLQRGLQYQNCIKVLKNRRPLMFVFENVKGVLSHQRDGVNTLQVILDDLVGVGYKVKTALVKMTDYNVPQKRERVLFLGVRNDLDIDPAALVPPITSNKTSLLLKDNLPFGRPDAANNIYRNHNLHTGTGVKTRWIQILNEGENLYNLSQEEVDGRLAAKGFPIRAKPKSVMGYRRLNGAEVAPTMMFGNTCLPIHPTEDRNLSVREAAFLQGFPTTFEFRGGISAQYKQVGNAVPPMFSKALADHILDVLLDYLEPQEKPLRLVSLAPPGKDRHGLFAEAVSKACDEAAVMIRALETKAKTHDPKITDICGVLNHLRVLASEMNTPQDTLKRVTSEC